MEQQAKEYKSKWTKRKGNRPRGIDALMTDFATQYNPKVDSKGNIIGIASYKRLFKARGYQIILSYMSNKYKTRFLDILPYKQLLKD